jgi:hypothetical protein
VNPAIGYALAWEELIAAGPLFIYRWFGFSHLHHLESPRHRSQTEAE